MLTRNRAREAEEVLEDLRRCLDVAEERANGVTVSLLGAVSGSWLSIVALVLGHDGHADT